MRTDTKVVKCYYSETFSLEYDYHEGGWKLSYYESDGAESGLWISDDDVEDLKSFLKGLADDQ